MTNDDLKNLRTVVKEEVSPILDEKLNASEKRLRDEISVTEKRLRDEISVSEKRLKDEISSSEKRIVVNIVDFVSDHLMPVIDGKADKTDIDRLERKLDFYIDKTVDLKSRVDDIESLPTVAYELKVKKNKNPKS